MHSPQFTLTALYDNVADKGTAAFKVLTSDAKNTWLAMLQKGATMTMEMWSQDEKPNLTWSHPWASGPGFIVPWYLFGIRPLSPGFDTIGVKPQVGDLTSGKYSMPTVRGRITVAFTSTSDRFELSVTLPASTVGRLSVPLPTRTASAALAGGVVAILLDGKLLPVTELDGGYAVVEVGGGSHVAAADDALLG
jgi:alpha-L-rhamnosidase